MDAFIQHPIIRLLRWHSPAGAGFLFLSCLWGLIMASRGLPPLDLLLLFAVGAFLMRSAGCLYNDWVDQDLDRHVARTRNRPLAARSLSPQTAFMLLGLLLLASLAVVLQLNGFAIGAAFLLAALSIAYPWMKRLTHWPQAYLGMLFAGGSFVGWLAVKPGLQDMGTPFLLWLIGITWTLVYDTLYAYQDAADDQAWGAKSSALRLGPSPLRFFICCWGIMLGLLLLLGLCEHLGWPYYGGILSVAGHFVWQAQQLPTQDPNTLFKLFKANQVVGLLIALSLWMGV